MIAPLRATRTEAPTTCSWVIIRRTTESRSAAEDCARQIGGEMVVAASERTTRVSGDRRGIIELLAWRGAPFSNGAHCARRQALVRGASGTDSGGRRRDGGCGMRWGGGYRIIRRGRSRPAPTRDDADRGGRRGRSSDQIDRALSPGSFFPPPTPRGAE